MASAPAPAPDRLTGTRLRHRRLAQGLRSFASTLRTDVTMSRQMNSGSVARTRWTNATRPRKYCPCVPRRHVIGDPDEISGRRWDTANSISRAVLRGELLAAALNTPRQPLRSLDRLDDARAPLRASRQITRRDPAGYAGRLQSLTDGVRFHHIGRGIAERKYACSSGTLRTAAYAAKLE